MLKKKFQNFTYFNLLTKSFILKRNILISFIITIPSKTKFKTRNRITFHRGKDKNNLEIKNN